MGINGFRPIGMAAAALLGVMMACQPHAEPAQHRSQYRAMHLDPRLQGGGSSREVLSGAEVLVAEYGVVSPDTAAAELGPWRIQNGFFHTLPQLDERGAGIRATEYLPAQGITHAYLSYGEPLDSSAFNRVELDLRSHRNGNATLTWESDGRPAGIELGSLRTDAVTHGGDWERVVLSMVGHPAWNGTITNLNLYPCWKGPQSYDLRGIRLLQDEFQVGDDPSIEFMQAEPDPGGGSDDCGLLGPSLDKRRVWASDPGIPLSVEVDAHEGMHFHVDVAQAHPSREDVGAVVGFSLRCRSLGNSAESAWVELGCVKQAGGEVQWSSLEADLSTYSGSRLELQLLAWVGTQSPPTPPSQLARGRFLWAHPMLVYERSRDPRPDLILVTLDTLRADALGCYAAGTDTPFLDRFAEESILFREALAACNSTLPSHTSILTGQPVPTHGVMDNRSTLHPSVRTLAQALAQVGYLTAAAVSVEHLQPAWSGLGRGFDRFHEVVPGGPVNGALTLEAVEPWLRDWSSPVRPPVFLWLHLFDPHTPYTPPAPFAREFSQGNSPPPKQADPPTIGRTSSTREGEFLAGVSNGDFAQFLYRSGVAYTDTLMKRFVSRLESSGLLSNAAVLITADHGESFGEQQVWYNHQRVHPPVMRVPLILRLPNQSQGVVTDSRASGVDIARTFSALANLPPSAWGTGGASGGDFGPGGVDLSEWAHVAEGAQRRVWFVHSNQAQVGFRDDDVHYFHNVGEYLQLGPERAEPDGARFVLPMRDGWALSENMAGVRPELTARYEEAMEAWLRSIQAGPQVKAQLNSAQQDRMKALGYGGE